MSDPEIVERPQCNGRTINAELAAILETATTGHAVRLALNGRKVSVLRSNVGSRLAAQGHRGHVHQDGPEHIIVWAEKK